jgi:hypothetical protein
MRLSGRSIRLGVAALSAAFGLAAFGTTAAYAGQIVYAHGGDLWAMNDDGSNPHPLFTSSQAGVVVDGMTPAHQPVAVQPGGNGIAFVGTSNGSCAATPANCPGVYSLVGGKLTRLTAAPAPCGGGGISCASEEDLPAVTSDGRIVYERLDVASSLSCFYYCYTNSGYSDEYYVRKLDGSSAPLPWPVPTSPNNSCGQDPAFSGPTAADPADASVIAYQGDFLTDSCPGGPFGGNTYYPIDIDHSGGNPVTAGQPSVDDQFLQGLAFSQDGSLIADVETGDHKGIWVYPTGQSYGGSGARFYFAVQDPDDNDGNLYDHYMSGLAFVGNRALVFSANYNLYEVPARCWATAASSTNPQPNCTFSHDAVQLTHDGTPSAPDTSAAWTSSTTPIALLSAGGGGGTGGIGGGAGGTGSNHAGAPNTSLAKAAINRKTRTATFKFKGSAGTTGFKCALVKKQKKRRGHRQPKPSFSSCRSPKTYRHLSHGSYTFYVRAQGPGGSDASPASRSFSL